MATGRTLTDGGMSAVVPRMTRAGLGLRKVEGATMEIDKVKILELLRQRGLDDRAIWVDRTLPDRVDVSKNAGLLAMLNIDPAELMDAAEA